MLNDDLNNNLLASIRTGFIDKDFLSNESFQPYLVTNNKNAGEKVLTTLDYQLRHCDYFWFSVAFLTTSGIAAIINTLAELRERNIKGRVVVSQYLNFTQPEALQKLLQFKNLDVRIDVSNNFHAKGYLFRKNSEYTLLVGSSNLTANALCVNQEWNLKVHAHENSALISQILDIKERVFNQSIPVDKEFISAYELTYRQQRDVSKKANAFLKEHTLVKVTPNLMQQEALSNLMNLRKKENANKAIIISATGTGKTYLSAFDVQRSKPKSFLFVVHRANIAKAAMETYQQIFGNTVTMGLYSGESKEINNDFIFSTIQTIAKPENLKQFSPTQFDYIVIDETHRAGAQSYQRVLDYFTPKFLLGMTATPERTDGQDIFKFFDHNIAYEIRLHRAMEEDMLCPFHYYGITDVSVNGQLLTEDAGFSLLTADERINHIIEKINFYGGDREIIRGLIFCSNIAECESLSNKFNERGFKTVSLTGGSSEQERIRAIERLESNGYDRIDYIFTVDIFNEGIDIPSLNQIVMLRPTQSAIVFVQQLGRGLRKCEDKDYLTVIDFIGNYNNNFLVPVALYGDTSYNKDTLRKLMASGSSLIPGASTINFDKISRDKIFESIDSANMHLKKDLVQDYKLLKFKIGRTPMMIDFLSHGARDPFLYIKNAKSYFNFVADQKDIDINTLSTDERNLLEFFAQEINTGKRVEESLILQMLMHNSGKISISKIFEEIKKEYGFEVSSETLDSCVNNLNFGFATARENGKNIPLRETKLLSDPKLYDVIVKDEQYLSLSSTFLNSLKNNIFREFLEDNIAYAIHAFTEKYSPDKFNKGFILYEKYSRKDVFRILNWQSNPIAQNVGGYIVSKYKTNCPIFVNYHKEDDISNTTKYEDEFLDQHTFKWLSKSKRKLTSPDVRAIRNHNNTLRLPLFIKKENAEGTDFYYMGDVIPQDDSFIETSMAVDNEKSVSVVEVKFTMQHPVQDGLYHYITNKH